MQRVMPDSATSLRAIDPLEAELLESLEARDKHLYAIVSMATRYRAILADQVQLLRIGEDPDVVRAMLSRWQTIMRDIKKLAAEL
jgi:hypothetical protein